MGDGEIISGTLPGPGRLDTALAVPLLTRARHLAINQTDSSVVAMATQYLGQAALFAANPNPITLTVSDETRDDLAPRLTQIVRNGQVRTIAAGARTECSGLLVRDCRHRNPTIPQ